MKLKNILLTGLTVLALQWLKAQEVTSSAADSTVTTLEQSSPDSVTTEINPLRITSWYVWTYAVGTANKQTLSEWSMSTFGSIRVWWAGEWEMTEKVSANAVVAYDQTSGKSGGFLHSFWTTYYPTEGTDAAIGKIPTAGTFMIGSPVTPGGHFLFTAEWKAPLSWVGARVDKTLWSTELSVWGVVREKGIEPSIYVSRWALSGTAVLDPATHKVNGWVSCVADLANGANVFSMVWLDPTSISYSAMYTTKEWPKAFDQVGAFIDGQYDTQKNKFTHTQVGVLKNLNGICWAKIWLGVDLVKKEVQTILFINLSQSK